jgi:mannitol-1-/sugar-/sorbitol-6-/2-deoxyglucose-6-phosphatase
MPIETVIFDMDGVLVDSEVYWFKSRQEFARDLGLIWTDDDQRHAMGHNTIEWAEVMQQRLKIDWSLESIMADMKRRVMLHYDEHLPLRPGAIEAVKLAQAHFRLGLASGSPTEIIQHVMKLTGLDQVFEVMVFGDDIPNGKPAPDIYLEALHQLGMPAHTALGIEDSGNGIRSLKAAGMVAIAAPSPEFPLSSEILALADIKIDSLEEFSLALVQKIEVSA